MLKSDSISKHNRLNYYAGISHDDKENQNSHSNVATNNQDTEPQKNFKCYEFSSDKPAKEVKTENGGFILSGETKTVRYVGANAEKFLRGDFNTAEDNVGLEDGFIIFKDETQVAVTRGSNVKVTTPDGDSKILNEQGVLVLRQDTCAKVEVLEGTIIVETTERRHSWNPEYSPENNAGKFNRVTRQNMKLYGATGDFSNKELGLSSSEINYLIRKGILEYTGRLSRKGNPLYRFSSRFTVDEAYSYNEEQKQGELEIKKEQLYNALMRGRCCPNIFETQSYVTQKVVNMWESVMSMKRTHAGLIPDIYLEEGHALYGSDKLQKLEENHLIKADPTGSGKPVWTYRTLNMFLDGLENAFPDDKDIRREIFEIWKETSRGGYYESALSWVKYMNKGKMEFYSSDKSIDLNNQGPNVFTTTTFSRIDPMMSIVSAKCPDLVLFKTGVRKGEYPHLHNSHKKFNQEKMSVEKIGTIESYTISSGTAYMLVGQNAKAYVLAIPEGNTVKIGLDVAHCMLATKGGKNDMYCQVVHKNPGGWNLRNKFKTNIKLKGENNRGELCDANNKDLSLNDLERFALYLGKQTPNIKEPTLFEVDMKKLLSREFLFPVPLSETTHLNHGIKPTDMSFKDRKVLKNNMLENGVYVSMERKNRVYNLNFTI